MDKTTTTKELRLGNLFKDQLTGEILIIIGITHKDKTFRVLNRDKYPLPNGWKAIPIPLTEQWLIDFGILNSKNWSWNGYTIEYWVEDGDTACFVASADYVHQLQNLYFALTGEELLKGGSNKPSQDNQD